jgi:hypothetical protein
MAKRTGSSARHERGVRRTEVVRGARQSAAVAKGEKKRSSRSPTAPGRERRTPAPAPARERREARSPALEERATAPRKSTPLSRSQPIALPPPRIPTPPPPPVPRSMELEWGHDPGGSSPPEEPPFDRWVRRGDELLLKLAEHGAAHHEVRTDLREGRFYWLDALGRVSAQARAQLLCTYVPQTASVTMGWADPRTRSFALPRIPGMPSEIDDIDEEGAWHIAMAAADRAGGDYLYRARSPVQCMFLALSGLTFSPDGGTPFVPCTPVALVLSMLAEARAAADLGAEPVDTLRARISAAGAALLEQAEYQHRDTDWAFRLVRTGRRLGALAERLPRPTFFSVAKGASTVWLERPLADDLVESIALLEEEWRQFA